MPEPLAVLDIAALFGGVTAARERADAALLKAATATGFLCVTGVPEAIAFDAGTRADLLRIFALPAAELRRLWRQKFATENPNVYRGWFPLQPGNLTCKEGVDMGGDVAYGREACEASDPLREPTPMPPEDRLPGWHAAVRGYYLGMETVSRALMRSLARGLGVGEEFFDGAFERGLSTLRLLRYPVRTDLELAASADGTLWQEHEGRRRHVAGAPHVDSGFLTLLAQDRVAGLQARRRDGTWFDVPPREGTLVVNFGRVLERWTAGRVRATEHRVLGAPVERFSIAYFHEARADAEIRPLPIDSPDGFAPFLFGDYLWAQITAFVEFRGMEGLRRPRRA